MSALAEMRKKLPKYRPSEEEEAAVPPVEEDLPARHQRTGATPQAMTVSAFTQRFICYDAGLRVDLSLWPWMPQILNSEHTVMGRSSDGNRRTRPKRASVLTTSRQVAKSSALSFKLHALSALEPNFTSLFVSSARANMDEFVKERVTNTIRISPDLRKIYGVPRTATQVDPSTVSRLPNNSRIVFRSAFREHIGRVRGIPADAVAVDEIQDYLIDNFPVIFAATNGCRHPLGPVRMLAGTPTTTDNVAAHFYTKLSTQNTWLTRCPHCMSENPPGIEQIGRKGMICSRCGTALNPLRGRWVRKGAEDAVYEGYHLSQVLMPYTCSNDLALFETKWETLYNEVFKSGYSEGKIYNEYLGLPHDVGRKPITAEEVRACCNPYVVMRRTAPTIVLQDKHWPVFMGVDWGAGTGEPGTGYTVVHLMYLEDVGGQRIPQVFYARRYSGIYSTPTYIRDDIALLAQENNVELIGCDAGFGWNFINDLREMLPNGMKRIVPIRYGGHAQLVAYDEARAEIVLHRTKWMAKIFQQLQHRRVRLPNEAEYWDPFAQDVLNISVEMHSRLLEARYTHVSTDDSFHSLLYALTVAYWYYGEVQHFASAA